MEKFGQKYDKGELVSEVFKITGFFTSEDQLYVIFHRALNFTGVMNVCLLTAVDLYTHIILYSFRIHYLLLVVYNSTRILIKASLKHTRFKRAEYLKLAKTTGAVF